MADNMQNTQVKVKLEAQPAFTSENVTNLKTFKTRFNDAEYERWNEKLKSRNSSKKK
jgi:hypothetical protein